MRPTSGSVVSCPRPAGPCLVSYLWHSLASPALVQVMSCLVLCSVLYVQYHHIPASQPGQAFSSWPCGVRRSPRAWVWGDGRAASSRMAARIQRSLRKSRDPRCHVRGEQTGDFSDRQSLLVSQDVISKGVHLCFFLFLFLRLFPRWHPLVAVAATPVASETFSSRQILFLPAIHVPDKPELCGRS
ncbi:hypothetical protein J3E68DRAFT_42304 [Trichoderma sp. SZMC 28012]